MALLDDVVVVATVVMATLVPALLSFGAARLLEHIS